MSVTPRELAEITEALASRVADKLSNQPALLDAAQTATKLGVSISTVDRWTKTKVIPCIRRGNIRRYRLDQVIEALSVDDPTNDEKELTDA